MERTGLALATKFNTPCCSKTEKKIHFFRCYDCKGKKYKYWFMHTFRFKAYFPSIFGYKGFYCPQFIWQNQAYGIAPFCSFIFSAAFYSKFIGIVRNLNDFHLLLPQCESKLDDENVYLRQSALNIRCMTYWIFFFEQQRGQHSEHNKNEESALPLTNQ